MLRFGHDYVDIGEAAHEEQYRVRRLAGLEESARSLGFTLQEVASGYVSGQSQLLVTTYKSI